MSTLTAKWWKRENEKIICELCPRYCRLGKGQSGFCFLRYNDNGVLKTRGFGKISSLALDPIEKKPLYHFYPSKKILSLGTFGCNMGCKFCQNWDISKSMMDENNSYEYTSEKLISLAEEFKKRRENIGLAFTYNEPTIWAEWIMELSVKAKEHGLKTVIVTNAHITSQPINEVYQLIDAANIDLKSFNQSFYSKITLSHLKPVLDAISKIKEKETWIEITTLLIPGYNDSKNEITELSKWILQNCGADTPLHFSAFHPDYKMLDVRRTDFTALLKAFDIAKSIGLKYVYTGNVIDEFTGSTFCPNCSEILVRRNGYSVEVLNLEKDRCRKCSYKIAGVFN